MATFSRREFLAATTVTAASPAFGANWNQWRGPRRNGFAASDFEWPNSLSDGRLTEIWRTDLQPSYSGPIVSEGRVFVTESLPNKNESAKSFSLTDGKPLWNVEWPGAMSVPFFAKSNGSWIRSTPAISADKLLVGGMRDVLVCLNPETGTEIWRNDFVQTQGSSLPSFGFVCSPLIVGDFAYVQAGGGLLKLELATGKVVWRALADGGGMNGSAFSSPVLATIAGVEQLLVQTRTDLAGVDPAVGTKLWSTQVPAFRGMNIVPPTGYQDSVFTSSYGGGSFCYDVSRSGDNWLVKQKWKNSAQGYMSSPMVLADHVYLHLKNRRLTCMELNTGSQKWSSKPFGKYWSCVSQGDKMLALDERGELLLVQPQPSKFQLLDQRNVASNSWAHLAVVDDLVLVRDLSALIVFRWS